MNIPDINGWTPVSLSAFNDLGDMVHFSVKDGARVEESNRLHQTALH
jgi:ankyrin repeat protein